MKIKDGDMASINKSGRDQLSIIKNHEVCEVQPGPSDGTKETVLLASKPNWRNSKQTLEVNLNFLYLHRVKHKTY